MCTFTKNKFHFRRFIFIKNLFLESSKICKRFSDKLSQIAKINHPIAFIENVTKHIKLLNDISKFKREIRQKKTKKINFILTEQEQMFVFLTICNYIKNVPNVFTI